jgi:hypothetical protein
MAAFADWNEALGAAVQLYNARAMPKSDGSWDRRDEPTWHDKNVLMKACAAMRTSAHHGIPSTWRPSRALMPAPLSGTKSLLLEWIDELDFTVEYLCR